MVMMFNTTFKNIPALSWWSGLLVEETRVLGENHRPDKLDHINFSWYIANQKISQICKYLNGETINTTQVIKEYVCYLVCRL